MNQVPRGPSSRPARDQSADILRGLAIILVVLGHINRGVIASFAGTQHRLELLDFAIYSSHMPVFFLAGGYFCEGSLQRRTLGAYIWTRVWDVVYPYVIWSVIYVLASRAASHFTVVHQPLAFSRLLAIGWQPVHVLWFLYALLLLQAAAAAVGRSSLLIRSAALSLPIIAYFLGSAGTNGVLSEALIYAPFFVIGYLLSATGKPLVPRAIGSLTVFSVSALFFLLTLWILRTRGVSVPVSPVTLPLSFLGILSLAALSRVVASKCATSPLARHVSWLGTMSLPIYLLHVLTLAVAPRLLSSLGISSIIVTLSVGTFLGIYGSLLLFEALDWIGLTRLLALRAGAPVAVARKTVGPAS